MESQNRVASTYEEDIEKIVSWKNGEFARIEADLEDISKKMLDTKKWTVKMDKLTKQFEYKEQEKIWILLEYNTRIIAVNSKIIKENKKLIALQKRFKTDVAAAIWNIKPFSWGRSTYIHSWANWEIDDWDKVIATRR